MFSLAVEYSRDDMFFTTPRGGRLYNNIILQLQHFLRRFWMM